MFGTVPHSDHTGAHAWHRSAVRGERFHNVPGFIAEHMRPKVRVGLFGRVGLGTNDALSGDPQIDIAVAFGQHRVLMALVNELAKIDKEAYDAFASQVAAFGEQIGDLSARITGLNAGTQPTWMAQLDEISFQMSQMETDLSARMRTERIQRETRGVFLTAGMLITVGVAGWYVLTQR